MNRRIIAALLSVTMLLTAVGALAMTPGTYTGVAKGMFDGLTVEVTVTEDELYDIIEKKKVGTLFVAKE